MAQSHQSKYPSVCAAEGGSLGAEQAESTGAAWGFLSPAGPLPVPLCSQVLLTLLWMSLCLLTPLPSGQPWLLKPLDNQAAAKPRPNRFKEKAWLAVLSKCFHFRAWT